MEYYLQANAVKISREGYTEPETMSTPKKIVLKSSDGETFEVEETVALESQIFKDMIEDGCADNTIPLPNVTSKVLAKVIEYCRKHVEASGAGDDAADEEALKKWDAKFVEVDRDVLFDLIMAANYLNIESLLDLTCRTVADMIKGKDPFEIRKILGIESDRTPEEDEEALRENSWAFSDGPDVEEEEDFFRENAWAFSGRPDAEEEDFIFRENAWAFSGRPDVEEEEDFFRENAWAFSGRPDTKEKEDFFRENAWAFSGRPDAEEKEDFFRENAWAFSGTPDATAKSFCGENAWAFSGRPDAAAKSFRAIFDPGWHMTDSVTWKSFEVLETLRPQEQQSNATDTDQERQIQTQMCNEPSNARGGRPDAAAKNFRDSIARKSFEVLETRPARKQPNDGVPLLLPGRLTLEGCVQQEKSPDLPRVMQFNRVEQTVTKMPRYLGGLTAQSASSSCGPIGLPDGVHIVLLDALDQSTKNIDHVATADQCSPTLSLPEKKMVGKTLNRNCRTMSVIFEEKHQRFVRRCEGTTKSLGAMCISRKHGINQVSMVEPIHKQRRIHQWPFLRDWATEKGYSLGDERPVEVICISSPWPSALPRGGLIVGPIALSSSEFAAANNLAQHVGQDQSRGGYVVGPIALSSSKFAATNNLAQRVGQDQRGSGASGSENERTREQEDPRQDQRGSGASGSENERTRKQKDPKEKRTSITKDHLLQLPCRMTIKATAAYLKVSKSTVKRKWGECNMGPWNKRVWKPPDQHGKGNTSSRCETPSHNVQTGMEGELVGQNQEANESRQDFMGHQIALNPESGLIMVSRPPDQHGERNTSTARETPLHNVQTGIEGVPVGQNQEANEFRPDFTEGSIPLNTENGLIIGSSSEWASQVNDQSTLSTPYQNHNALVFPQPQITSMLSENRGGSIDRRNSLASQAEPFSNRHISGSSNLPIPTWSDQVAPSQHAEGQSVQSTVYPDHNAVHRFPEGHVFESIYWNEQTNSLASQAEPFSDRLVSRSIWIPPDQLEGQTMQFTAHPNPNALGLPQFQIASSQVPSANEAAPSQLVATILTERQGPWSVTVKAIYGNGNRIIKFPLPLKSGIKELMQEVSKTLDWELGSFDVDYKDEYGDWILMARDDNVSEYLQLLISLGNRATKLEVRKKVPDTTNICETCGSLKLQRP